MPIRIPSELPAQDILLKENIFVMNDEVAQRQDIRPLEVGILNLMPNKIQTESQLCRLLSNTPLQINIDLIRIDGRESKHTPKQHLDMFYHDFQDVQHKRYDGLIITGAPVAHLPYEEIAYWQQITQVMDWATSHVQSTLYLCWAAHAAMYHHFNVQRKFRDEKLFGVFEHEVYRPLDELVRGFDPFFWAPHSRYGHIATTQYEGVSDLHVLAGSEEVGAYIIASEDKRIVFLTGHPEYDLRTLRDEYYRDLSNGTRVSKPKHYFKQDNPELGLQMTWRSHGTLLFTNWLNYYVYQTTPYDLKELSANDL
ncbi:homoserine O-succinyltransferase [Alteromonas sp. a30]|uniref:homoserine O-succinyltransferase n=1 Tax=Alteromonas sp. a30 TaxID=2730917 RepID=UPI00227ED67A|nr:homoserine O-succinyltransferase [Alteromonas sp. a30]MCY7295992.1 homoserine O-succinyltransferase [Alteromonas sp. a30]